MLLLTQVQACRRQAGAAAGLRCGFVCCDEQAAEERHAAGCPHAAAGAVASKSGQQRREQHGGLHKEAGSGGSH